MAFWCQCIFAELFIAILVLAVAFVLYSKHVYNYWTKHNVPQLLEKPKLFFGTSKKTVLRKISLADRMVEIYNELKQRKLAFVGTYFMLKPEVVIIDPELIKDVMLRDFQNFTDRGMFADPKNEPLSAHLFSLGGQKWRDLRVKLTPTFTSGKMKMMFHTLVACSDELKDVLDEKAQKGEPLEMKEILARFTTDVIGSCAFGIECNCLKNPDNDFRKYGEMVFKRSAKDMFRFVIAIAFPKLFRLLKLKAMNPEVTDFFMNVVKETVRYREENNVERNDFLQILMELKNEKKSEEVEGDGEDEASKAGLTIEEIAAQCFLFFLAGFETSSTTMTFCLYELAKNPEIQEKVRQEIVTVMKKHGGQLTYEGIMEMHYMDKVIQETLRKYPPVPFLFRQCTEDYKLPNSEYVLRKGMTVRIPILGLQMDSEFYPDSEKFDPERFSPEEKAKRHQFTWLPFGEGPRVCIGLRFGMMQTKVGLSTVLKNFRLTVNDKTLNPVVMDPTSNMMSMKGGTWLDLHKL